MNSLKSCIAEDKGERCRDSPPKTSPKTVTKNMTIKRMADCFRTHKASPIGDFDENDRKRGYSQLLGVLVFICRFDLHVDVASSN